MYSFVLETIIKKNNKKMPISTRQHAIDGKYIFLYLKI